MTLTTEPDLTGKAVVVTGSTRGLGLAFARDLVQHGAAVVINGRDYETGAATLGELTADGARVVFVPGPVGHEDVAENLIQACIDSFGHIDVLVNNAGIIRDRTLTRMSADEFDDVVDAHLRGTWLASRAAARAMRDHGGGSILNIVSGSALFGLVGQSNYAAAKGGILALTRALSLELARFRITVNALYPAALTDMTATVVAAAGGRAGTLPAYQAPEEVAPVVTFLASNESQALTGQVLSFDGRTLSVWSHPAPTQTLIEQEPWSAAQVASAFADGRLRPEPLHPDAIGQAVREALHSPPDRAEATAPPRRRRHG